MGNEYRVDELVAIKDGLEHCVICNLPATLLHLSTTEHIRRLEFADWYAARSEQPAMFH